MKLSVLTPTYNRAEDLEKLYTSLIVNSYSNLDFEWLIMDDGSTDKTKMVVDRLINQKIIDIKYYYQENSGKMSAMNELVKYATGDMMITCDSDDYFTPDAFENIMKYAKLLEENDDTYALAFLIQDSKENISGNEFEENVHKASMFDFYYKERKTGELALLFKSSIRKKYSHKLEEGEKFVTEARLYHEMDEDYHVIGINTAIMVREYQDDGYSKNLDKVMKENPVGYYHFFKELLEKDLNGVTFAKKKYIYKHYVLFSILSEAKNPVFGVDGIANKLIVMLLWIPGLIVTKYRFKN